ncbi:hypothetical protein B0A50_08548 [Salinomyces thailandicus]|uniref:Vacuolar membrane-associated protein IML1 n=1 Tax=Salinomyces thailandicus TaxID=706561 RepID=A0A4U0TJG7_9PEZI|nr:hypothetical protein B0A50_08548 [Salinomyces thailandica]
MWRIMRQFDDTVLHKGQKIKFLGSTAAEVEALYIKGREVDSAFATQARTKPIFRSGSARYTILLQLSKEMLEGWIDGELMYERAVNGFLPELFQRWSYLGVRHSVTVVLFGRVDHGSNMQSKRGTDFYHVVAADLPCTQWRELLRKLRRALNDDQLPRQLSLAAKGNMLEAMYISVTDFANDNIDPHLSSTGTSVIALTAGAGLFETDRGLLNDTTRMLMGNSIGVDIVALSPKPLHPVPLFAYQRVGAWEYALPHWVDISFWHTRTPTYTPSWLLPTAVGLDCEVSLPPLDLQHADDNDSRIADMEAHDDGVFAGNDQFRNRGEDRELSVSASSASTLKRSSPNKKSPHKASVQENTGSHEHDDSEKLASYGGEGGRRPKEASAPHPLMAAGRKISLGPKGLAPSRGIASTTVTTEHAQQGREPSLSAIFAPNEGSSGIAKQIRQTLARKSSQQSLTSQSDATLVEASRPINIGAGREADAEESDLTSVLERNVLATVSENELTDESGMSQTPKAKRDPFYAAMKAAEEEGHWTTSPWVTLLNPCNPKRSNMRVAAQYRKWQHVFPRAVSSGTFKWRSMCSPATLPLTAEYRPSLRQLEHFPLKTVRRLLIRQGKTGSATSAERVLEQLVSLRFLFGFQHTSTTPHGREQPGEGMGSRVVLSLGNTYHELRCLSDAEIQTVEYSLGDSGDEIWDDKLVLESRMKIKTPVTSKANKMNLPSVQPQSQPDWAKLDESVVSQDHSVVDKYCFQMRLVLIPVEPPRASQGISSTARELSDEERRIDGIQKLTQLWQRSRYFTTEDQQHHASLARPKTVGAPYDRDPNPLAIEYETRDPSMVVNAYGPTLSGQLSGDENILPLFAESELYHSSTFDVAKLVAQMQEPSPHGVEVRDRRWFTRLHFRCFRGDEMVNWLLRVFRDLHSREDAVAIGNELMKRGIFTHVRHRHAFLDGNFFYQITSAHRTTEYPDNASMFSKTSLRSVPPTPTVERNSPVLRAVQMNSPLSKASHRESSSSGMPTPILAPLDKKRLFLSQEMLLNVDTNGKSDQLEIVHLHYDRLHNPENCYHIQLEWLTATPKLIREAINRWSSLVESYGLRLVQLPLAEASILHIQRPFDQPLRVKLAVNPPERGLTASVMEPYVSLPRAMEDPVAYQKALLRRLDFVLDFEAAASFTTKIDVHYSYGTEDDWYERTSFCHVSGLVLAQITGDEQSDFVLVPNRLAASQKLAASGKHVVNATPVEEIVRAFVDFCHDEKALRAFYKELHKPIMTPSSPFIGETHGLDSDVPPISLPPHLMHRAALKGI